MKIKKILDLFCGAGGSAIGLHQAIPDAEIIGVDINPQKHYPFAFIQADAMTYPLDGFDLIWASPPCQQYSATKNFVKKEYPDLVEPLREKLIKSEKYYIIENVPRAPLKNYVILCGTMFGLNVIRHRLFECNPQIIFPPHLCNHNKKTVRQGMAPNDRQYHCIVGRFSGLQKGKEAMQIFWMNTKELSQAIPPAYSEWLGKTMRSLIE